MRKRCRCPLPSSRPPFSSYRLQRTLAQGKGEENFKAGLKPFNDALHPWDDWSRISRSSRSLVFERDQGLRITKHLFNSVAQWHGYFSWLSCTVAAPLQWEPLLVSKMELSSSLLTWINWRLEYLEDPGKKLPLFISVSKGPCRYFKWWWNHGDRKKCSIKKTKVPYLHWRGRQRTELMAGERKKMVRWTEREAWKYIHCHIWSTEKTEIRCMNQGTQPGAL